MYWKDRENQLWRGKEAKGAGDKTFMGESEGLRGPRGCWELRRVSTSPGAHPEQFPSLDFRLHTRGGWRSRKTVSWSIFVALIECNSEAKPFQARGKDLSVSDLFIHQIFFNFCLSLFNPKDTSETWSQRPALKPSTTNGSINRTCCFPRLG